MTKNTDIDIERRTLAIKKVEAIMRESDGNVHLGGYCKWCNDWFDALLEKELKSQQVENNDK